jgi:hypothetical protein
MLILFGFGRAHGRPDDFLNRPMPRGIFPIWKPGFGENPKDRNEMDQFDTFQDRLIASHRWMPRPVIVPEGLYDFIAQVDAQDNPHNSMLSPFQDEKGGSSSGPRVSYRDFLSDTCSMLGLKWMYDARRDAIVTDFAWRRDDPRSPRELIQFLAATQPRPSNDLGLPIDKNGSPDLEPDDPWRAALDALISDPENFPRTWKLRFIDEMRTAGFYPFPGKIIWSGQLPDTDGQPHFVVIKYHAAFSMPGPTATFDCYVFKSDGRFESGAILSDRYEAMTPPIISNSASRETLTAMCNGRQIGTFAIQHEEIVFSPATTYPSDLLGKAIYRSAGSGN